MFQDEMKIKHPVFNCLVLDHVYGFFILCTHFLQSQSANTANLHNYHLLLHFHQKVGIGGLYNLDYVLIFFNVNILLWNGVMNLTSNLNNCIVINGKGTHHSNLKGAQMKVWIFIYLYELRGDDTALILSEIFYLI